MSITRSIHRGKHMYGDKIALSFADRQTSYSQLHDDIASCAGALVNLDPIAGGSVGILSLNCDRAIIGFYGAMWAGKVPNYLNIRWSIFELGASVDDFAPSILLVDKMFLDMGLDLQTRCNSVEHVILIEEQDELPPGVLSYTDALAQASPISDQSVGDHEMAFLNYTGGTTGKGKGVIHSHASHTATLAMCIAENLFCRGRALMTMPLFHISGTGISNAGLMAGNTLYILPAYDPLKVLQTLQDEEIESAFMVPTMWQMLLHHPDFPNYDLSTLRYLRYGGSPIDETLMMDLKAALPGADFMQVYGQTEGLPISMLYDCDHTAQGVKSGRTRSAGTVGYGVELEIRDPDGNALPPGAVGEITFAGPMLMLGYLNMPEKTAETLIDGRLHSGDAGFLSADGYLHVVDRIKDMIITGGENVYSAEVETVIMQLTGVAQCALIGIADEKWGERVHAEVILKPGPTLSEAQLITHCKTYLAGYKAPKSVAFVDAIPLTAVGKVDKVAIREKFK
jgi:acyl-CoA synthetase (AMP-forming)/AMP-acid ligase II